MLMRLRSTEICLCVFARRMHGSHRPGRCEEMGAHSFHHGGRTPPFFCLTSSRSPSFNYTRQVIGLRRR
jgi:hypothetical protein